MAQRFQVVIVGGGPVGVALGIDLALRGVSCAVVERHPAPQRIPKGQNLAQRTLEHFYYWGVEPELRAARLLPKDYPIGTVTAYGNLMSEHWYAAYERAGVQPYFFQMPERLPQYLTEEVLRRRMAQLPLVAPFFGWTAESVEQDDGGVRVSIVQEATNARDVLEADYAVGCDGARGSVRDQLGIDRSGVDYGLRMALLVFRSKQLHEALERLPPRTTYRVLHPDFNGLWQFFGRIDVGEGWFFHAPVPADTTAENYNFHALLARAAGFEFPCDFDYIGFWDMRIAVADAYSKGRVFIAGDAAHSHPPYGAYGLNSGLDDVANLGWKLAGALQGWGGPALLDSYSEERQPVFYATGMDMIAGGITKDGDFLARYSPERDPEAFAAAWRQLEEWDAMRLHTYVPHYEGSSVVFGPADAVCGVNSVHSFLARAGHHLAPLHLSSGRNVYEELGPGFTLLALDAPDAAVSVFEAAATAQRLPFKVVRDSIDAERAQLGARYVLVRPDQHVAWAGNDAPEEPWAVLRRAAGFL